LLPEGSGRARLLSIGDVQDDGLSQSRLIASQIDTIDGAPVAFASQPRIADPLCGPDLSEGSLKGGSWLACGTAAVSFDPVCGEGAGHALREAILANAVIQASLAGSDDAELTRHYRTRIIAGFARHLQTCVELYTSGHQGPWWDTQIESLNDGLAWCRDQLKHETPPKFRLENFTLQPV
jgi:hypothetical protein